MTLILLILNLIVPILSILKLITEFIMKRTDKTNLAPASTIIYINSNIYNIEKHPDLSEKSECKSTKKN